jgi:hypothetical protein
MAANGPVDLTGAQIGEFVDALEGAYSAVRFDQMLMIYLSQNREHLTLANDQRSRFYDVIVASGLEGWTAELIEAALDANSRNARLQKFVRSIGLNPVAADEESRLQKVITEQSVFQDPDPFFVECARRCACVCQIEVPGGGGTGTLVAPDVVLTNHHVVTRLLNKLIVPEKVNCVFDFKMLSDGHTISPGRRVALHASWDIASRPHSAEDEKHEGGQPAATDLDYALLRLAEPVGDQRSGAKGQADPLAPKRGWLPLRSDAAELAVGDPIMVVQHPLFPGKLTQAPVQLALGSVKESPFKERLRHNARALHGSSGSPCLDAKLDFVALHHVGDPITAWQKPSYNQAIPVQKIVDDLKKRNGVPQIWDQAPA